MREWPAEVETMLHTAQLPSADMDASLDELIDMASALLDIPTDGSRIHALHVMFTTLAHFRSSHHFRELADANALDNQLKQGTSDRLEL